MFTTFSHIINLVSQVGRMYYTSIPNRYMRRYLFWEVYFESMGLKLPDFDFTKHMYLYTAEKIYTTRPMVRSLRLCKYDPTVHISPFIKVYSYSPDKVFPMLLDELFWIQENLDSALSFRRSCREGICGSCAMNINGTNSLACIYHVGADSASNIVYPLAHLPIIRDLVVSLKHFYNQYKSIQPWVHLNASDRSVVRQYPGQRGLLDGLYECILCACCSTSCPSYWWNSDNYLGPAILLQALRWIVDSRDIKTVDRVSTLNDSFKLYRCHSIMNCAQCCPKGLNPALAIAAIKKLVVNTARSNSIF